MMHLPGWNHGEYAAKMFWSEGYDDGVDGRPPRMGNPDYKDGYYNGQREREELDRTGSSNT